MEAGGLLIRFLGLGVGGSFNLFPRSLWDRARGNDRDVGKLGVQFGCFFFCHLFPATLFAALSPDQCRSPNLRDVFSPKRQKL